MINIKMTEKKHKVSINIQGGAQLADLTAAMYHLGTALAKVKDQDEDLWQKVKKESVRAFTVAANGGSAQELLYSLLEEVTE